MIPGEIEADSVGDYYLGAKFQGDEKLVRLSAFWFGTFCSWRYSFVCVVLLKPFLRGEWKLLSGSAIKHNGIDLEDEDDDGKKVQTFI